MQASVFDLQSAKGIRTVVVLRPPSAVQLGLERLEELRRRTDLSPMDAQLLLRTLRTLDDTSRPSVVLLRLDSEGGSLLRIDPALSDANASELAVRYVGTQLHIYRRLAMCGVAILVVVGLSPREVSLFREASALVAREQASLPESPTRALDLWLLQQFVLYQSESVSSLLTRYLPSNLDRIEHHAERLRGLVQRAEAYAPIAQPLFRASGGDRSVRERERTQTVRLDGAEEQRPGAPVRARK